MIWAFTELDFEQKSEAWYKARAGRATASRAGDVLAKVKSGEAAGRRNYRIQLVTERLTGTSQEAERFTSKFMERGTEREPEARARYEELTGELVMQSGFLAADGIEVGASLDGRVGGFRGIVSFKCPLAATHVTYLRGRRLPPEYVPQATHEMMLVSQAEWYDFVSYCPELPKHLALFRVRIERNELAKEIEAYEPELIKFLKEVDADVIDLLGRT
jgi:YqaJ-like viral recombinase domain